MHRPSQLKCSSKRRGAVAVFAAISLVTLLLCASLAVDVGYICVLTGEAQTTADAAAYAGAGALRELEYDSIIARVNDIIARNQSLQGFSSPDDQIVQIGRWDRSTQTFVALPEEEVGSANAVRVVAVRNDVPLFFAALAGRSTTSVQREAVAMFLPLCSGLWGVDTVTVSGTVDIDSYDSTEGPYSGVAANQNGDLCSNGTITLQGNASIGGDIRTSEVVLNGGAISFTGVVEDSLELATPPTIDFGDAMTDNDNATIGLTDAGTEPLDNSSVSTPGTWDLILKNSESLTLAPGTYFFDDIQMTGTSSLTITGPTTIYLDDDLEMGGSTVLNTSQNTADLIIICDGDSDGSKIKINGNVEFYGSILAPESEIELKGNADFYGVIIGRTLDFGGSFAFHLDESLWIIHEMKDRVTLAR